MWLGLGGFGQLGNARVGLKGGRKAFGVGGCQGLESEKGEI